MGKMFKISSVLVLSAAFITSIYAAPKYKDGDWQLWNDETFKGKINDRWGVQFEQEFRWGKDMSQFYYEHSHMQVDFKALEWLTISPAYRHVYELNSKEVWYPTYEPQINIAGKWKIFEDWTFEARVRFLEKIYDEPGKSNAFVNRDKFTLKSPWKWTPLKLNPYIADEIFFQQRIDGLAENRLWIGLGMEFFEHLKGDISYIWREQHQSDDSWLESNVIQAQLKLDF